LRIEAGKDSRRQVERLTSDHLSEVCVIFRTYLRPSDSRSTRPPPGRCCVHESPQPISGLLTSRSGARTDGSSLRDFPLLILSACVTDPVLQGPSGVQTCASRRCRATPAL
jgi:hypothetical protein